MYNQFERNQSPKLFHLQHTAALPLPFCPSFLPLCKRSWSCLACEHRPPATALRERLSGPSVLGPRAATLGLQSAKPKPAKSTIQALKTADGRRMRSARRLGRAPAEGRGRWWVRRMEQKRGVSCHAPQMDQATDSFRELTCGELDSGEPTVCPSARASGRFARASRNSGKAWNRGWRSSYQNFVFRSDIQK